MTLSTKVRRTASLAAVTAITGSAALAGGASAATIGAPEVLTPGANLPINFAAFKEPADNKLPANYRIVRESVQVARGEKASTVISAPKGFKIVTIGFGDGHQVGGAVNDVHYASKRSVRVRLFVDRNVVKPGQTGKGTLYLLARRGARASSY
jgi:hypothetical protein